MSLKKTPITVAHGDGIGPEIMSAVLKILFKAGRQLGKHGITRVREQDLLNRSKYGCGGR